MSQSDPREALRLSEEAYGLAAEAVDSAGRAEALLNAGWALIYTAEYELALTRLHEALQMYDESGDQEGRMKALNALGVISHRIGAPDQSLEYYKESLDIARSVGSRGRELAALNNIGELSFSIDQPAEALRYYTEAHALAEALADDTTLCVVKINLGGCYHVLGDHGLARQLLQEGLTMSREVNDRIAEAECLTKLGLLNEEEGNYTSAEEGHRRSLAICEELNHPTGVIEALNNLGKLHHARGMMDTAQKELERSVELSTRIDAPAAKLGAFEDLTRIYQAQGDLSRALETHRALLDAQRRISGEEATRRLFAVRMQHELESSRSEAEIVRLRNVDLREKSEQLDKSYRQMQLVGEIGREITASLDLDDLTDTIYRRINQLMDASVFGIAIYDDRARTIDYALIVEEGQRLTPFMRDVDSKKSFGAWCVRNRKEVWLNNVERQYRDYIEERSSFSGKRASSLVYLPLLLQERVVGVLTVQSYTKNSYTETQLDMLRALAAYVAIALDNSTQLTTIQQLNKALRREKAQIEEANTRIAHMANHDNLTGLPNRRLLIELLREYIPLAQRQKQQFGLLYMDLDDFKPVNDRHGHAAGDDVLTLISSRLRESVRASDTVARIAGDEFVLVVRDVLASGGLDTIADKVLSAVTAPVLVGTQQVTLSASIGISLYPDDGDTYDELLRAADAAMYTIKQGGKCGIAFASETRGEIQESKVPKISDSSIWSSENTNLPET